MSTPLPDTFSLAFQPRATGFAFLTPTRGKTGSLWSYAALPPGRVMIFGEWSGPRRARLHFRRAAGEPAEVILDMPASSTPTRIGPIAKAALDSGATLAVDAYSLDQSDIDNAILSLTVTVIPFSS